MKTASSAGGLDVKTLITTGVFTALYFVLLAVGGIAGILNPLMMFIGPLISILISGPVIILFLRKVRAPWALAIMGFLIGLLIFMGGHIWYTIIVATLTGLLGDLIARAGKYRNRALNVLAYAVFSLWNITPLTPILYDTDNFLQHITESLGADFAQQMGQIFTPAGMLLFAACVFASSLVSGWVGALIVEKHFKTN
ncbi:MptD family putative ECF transporter S component [Boudabousia marimammalium]|uniref:Uncharacterized protein n=1 Tax=Boudabousia marimammalium TaxID=156892 RepID=A0A1Q5PSF5_9ACTO|nr:MptD family putative ECF transporter S component [Boudabousia marimammalium]OKL50496.1 hypothetical protein BM477_00540 [Boudabousia marimammalium]